MIIENLPKISVIIPIYNSEKHLKECVESVLNQTFKNFEIILVDDGSSDASANICDVFAEKHSFVKVVHKENQGVSKARNVGIGISSGEYITFLDSDDYLEKNFFQKGYSLVKENNCDLYVSGLTMEVWGSDNITSAFKYGRNDSQIMDVKRLLE